MKFPIGTRVHDVRTDVVGTIIRYDDTNQNYRLDADADNPVAWRHEDDLVALPEPVPEPAPKSFVTPSKFPKAGG